MVYLPYDVFTYILNELDRVKDIATLRSLSTCCSDFRPIAQRKIFHTLDLKYYTRTRQNMNQIIRLQAVLQSSPCIADYVRSFEFCYLKEDMTVVPSSPIVRLGTILAMLHHVKALVWLAYGVGFLDWVSFHARDVYQNLSQAILGVLPNLIFLKIEKVKRFPLNIMARSNVLLDITENSYLSISLAVVPDINCDGSDTHNSSPYPRIRNYRIGRRLWPRKLEESRIEGVQCLHSIDPPMPPFDFGHLQSLEVTWKGQGQGDFPSRIDTEKIMNCTSTLKEFTCIVFPSSTFNGLSRLIQARQSRSLTTLNVKLASPIGLQPSQLERLESLCHELSVLGGRNHLERLSIAIELPEGTSGMQERDLQGLDATITRDTFRSLKAVGVLIDIVKTADFSSKTLVSDREFCSTDELATYLSNLYGGYFEGLQSIAGLTFLCKVIIA